MTGPPPHEQNPPFYAQGPTHPPTYGPQVQPGPAQPHPGAAPQHGWPPPPARPGGHRTLLVVLIVLIGLLVLGGGVLGVVIALRGTTGGGDPLAAVIDYRKTTPDAL